MGRFPTKIRTLGKDYKIIYTKSIWNGKNRLLGQTVLKKGKIKILPDMHRDFTAETLLHEVIHCIDYSTNLDLTEEQVLVLAPALQEVLRNNPIFWRMFK